MGRKHNARWLAFGLLALVSIRVSAAHAQSDATTDPREFSEAARKEYAQKLKDARALLNEKKYAEAIEVLDKLHAERPREPQARFLKGLALADSGKTDAAIAIFQAVLGDYPELPEPHNNLAVLYAQKGEYRSRWESDYFMIDAERLPRIDCFNHIRHGQPGKRNVI